MAKIKTVSVTELKAHALQIIETVKTSKQEVQILKHGKLVAKIVPIEQAPAFLGSMKGTVTYPKGSPDSILEPLDLKWDAEK